MRGPGYKITGDVRRTWRCPQCGRERKLLGDVTTLECGCREGAWMQIVAERNAAPRPIQRPSDIEHRPIDFGVEPAPPPPPKPEATIIKSAVSHVVEIVEITEEVVEISPMTEEPTESEQSTEADDEWGEGIL